MTRLAVAALAGSAFVGVIWAIAPVQAQEAGLGTASAMPAVEWSSQSTRRPRVRVTPEPQPPFWDYPRPGTYSWPGPNAKRDCKAWYVVENRATGPTLTPRMTCRWVPG
jgi:hypothetical protein